MAYLWFTTFCVIILTKTFERIAHYKVSVCVYICELPVVYWKWPNFSCFPNTRGWLTFFFFEASNRMLASFRRPQPTYYQICTRASGASQPPQLRPWVLPTASTMCTYNYKHRRRTSDLENGASVDVQHFYQCLRPRAPDGCDLRIYQVYVCK